MNEIDFMGWLDTDLGDELEVVLAGLDEHLALQGVSSEERELALHHASELMEIIHQAQGKMNMTVEFNGETHQVTQ